MSGMKENNTQGAGIFKKAFGRWLGLFLVVVTALVLYLIMVNLDNIFGYIFMLQVYLSL